MKAYLVPFFFIFFCACGIATGVADVTPSVSVTPTGPGWRGVAGLEAIPNQWIAYRGKLSVGEVPDRYPVELIADSKYWLWVNGELRVREGGLKHGPAPGVYYADTLDLTPWLKAGENTVAVLLWYFGKPGFSHQDNGIPGLWLDGPDSFDEIPWKARLHPAFGSTQGPHPNYRLPESNVRFDANHDLPGWTAADYDDTAWPAAVIPWQAKDRKAPERRPRPIPQWKDFGLIDYPEPPVRSAGIDGPDTLKVKLPYNAQVTPYFRIRADRPYRRIEILTDNYRGGGPPNVRAVYYTRAGEQAYENPGWMNGHEVWYVIPAGVEILELKYRESGYPTEFSGSFSSSDPDLNALWTKAQRTLYLTMRDTYMDCPERERAQWWGDVVNELGETFYALDRRSDLLTTKAIRELADWQRPDSTLFSPVPAGNWNQELPMQMLASVGYYGFWHYHFQTADTALLRDVYPAVKRYLGVWKQQESGLVIPRKGGWTWGDWGDNKDLPLLYNAWYYLAQKGLANVAEVLGDESTARAAKSRMERLAPAFNRAFWTGTAYRSPEYRGQTDDRGNALAVVSGIAGKEKYPALYEVLKNEKHASPYMEKYVLEALCRMDRADYAIDRMKERFGPMIHSELTTLWEGWSIGDDAYGGGTYNHAWSGGALTVMSEFLSGVVPTSPGWKTVSITPRGWKSLRKISANVPTPRGPLTTQWTYENDILTLEWKKPEDMDFIACNLPPGQLLFLDGMTEIDGAGDGLRFRGDGKTGRVEVRVK